MFCRFFLFTILLLAFCLVGCGDDDDNDNDGDSILDDDTTDNDDDANDDPTPPDGWRLELVDGNYATGNSNVIDLTSSGSPVIYYAGAAGLGYDGLTKLAVKNAASWQREKISKTEYPMQQAVIVDADDHVHVAFSHWVGYKKILEYRHNVNGDWTSAIVIEGGVYVDRFSLALDSAANAHFVYTDDDDNLYYGSPTAAGWDFSLFAQGVNPAIALDGNDVVHIVYSVPSDIDYPDDPSEKAGKIYHLHNADGEWTREIVDELADDLPFHDPEEVTRFIIKVDDDDRLHLAYVIKYEKDSSEEEFSYRTKYATTNNEGEWIGGYLTDDRFILAGMDLDADATPFILARDQMFATMSLFVTDGQHWLETPLGLENGVADLSTDAADLAIDAQGYAHMSYATTFTGDEKLIHQYYLTNRPL